MSCIFPPPSLSLPHSPSLSLCHCLFVMACQQLKTNTIVWIQLQLVLAGVASFDSYNTNKKYLTLDSKIKYNTTKSTHE